MLQQLQHRAAEDSEDAHGDGDLNADGHDVDVWEQCRRHQDARQQEQHVDDDPGNDVEPARVHPRAEHLAVIAQQEQENARARQQQPSQGLHRCGDKTQRRPGDEGHDRCDDNHRGVRGVELLGFAKTAVQGVPQVEHVAEGVTGRESDGGRPDDAGVQQHDREDRPEQVAVRTEQAGDPAGVGELPGGSGAASRPRGSDHQAGGADDHHHRAQDRVHPLVADESRRDPLVDDVGLLEEQLPRRDGRPDDGDDQQDRVGTRPALNPRHDEVVCRGPPAGVGQ